MLSKETLMYKTLALLFSVILNPNVIVLKRGKMEWLLDKMQKFNRDWVLKAMLDDRRLDPNYKDLVRAGINKNFTYNCDDVFAVCRQIEYKRQNKQDRYFETHSYFFSGFTEENNRVVDFLPRFRGLKYIPRGTSLFPDNHYYLRYR